MIPCLNNATTGAASFEGFLQAATAAGFPAIEVGLGQLEEYVRAHSLEALKEELRSRGLKLGSGGAPVNWQGTEEQFTADLDALPRRLELCQQVGLERLCTWVPPRWNVPYVEAFAFCRDRLGAVADALGKGGIRFGLEFVGPQGNFLDRPYKFISTLAEMMHFIEKMGRDNLGLLLDSYHLYVAEAPLTELAALPESRIVQFHINDAYPGIPRPQLEDLKRLLPGQGAIPLVPMLRALAATGYDWTLSIETFSDEVKAQGPAKAAKMAKDAVDSILAVL
jgi:sugar phosphate isomerase/epimerase